MGSLSRVSTVHAVIKSAVVSVIPGLGATDSTGNPAQGRASLCPFLAAQDAADNGAPCAAAGNASVPQPA